MACLPSVLTRIHGIMMNSIHMEILDAYNTYLIAAMVDR